MIVSKEPQLSNVSSRFDENHNTKERAKSDAFVRNSEPTILLTWVTAQCRQYKFENGGLLRSAILLCCTDD